MNIVDELHFRANIHSILLKRRIFNKIKMINQILGYEKEMEEQNLNALINKMILNL